MIYRQEFVFYSLTYTLSLFFTHVAAGSCSGVAFSDISPSWSIGSSFESQGSWLSSQRFGILKCRYCLPLTTSLSPITTALFLESKLLAFFMPGIKIFFLISWTRFGKSSPILMLESLRLRRIFHTLWRSLRQLNRPMIGLGRLRLCLPRRCTPQNCMELVYFFTFNLEVVDEYLPYETNSVFIATFRNFVKDHIPTSAVYFLSNQFVILVGLLLLAFCYAVEGFCLVFLCKFN